MCIPLAAVYERKLIMPRCPSFCINDFFILFTLLKNAAVNHSKKQAYMAFKLFYAFLLHFGPAVAFAYQNHNRSYIHHRKRFGIFCAYLARFDKSAENICVIIYFPLHISLGIKLCEFIRTELLNSHHSAKSADSFVMKRISIIKLFLLFPLLQS